MTRCTGECAPDGPCAGDWKLVQQGAYGRATAEWELYNLASDLGETQNLAAQQPEKLAELVHRWQSMDEQMAEPFWSPQR